MATGSRSNSDDVISDLYRKAYNSKTVPAMQKIQLITIANEGRSFGIRHLCLPVTSPCGRNGYFAISGLTIKLTI